jgi:pimeloyl-ACP methyl ester carboxylesterase
VDLVNEKAGSRKVLFLPGALGDGRFWHPVGESLPDSWAKQYFDWPGLGDQPPDPTVRGFDDLVRLVEREIDRTVDVVAHSMGGVVAVRIALDQPDRVRRLVLVATSGGVDVARLGGADWREDYRHTYVGADPWVTTDQPDHTQEIGRIEAPTLLLWGEQDQISPVAVGRYLESLLPHATLRVIEGGTHSLALERADEITPVIATYLC